MKKPLFYSLFFVLICGSSLQKPLINNTDKLEILGDWGIIKIGDGTCNLCPELTFYSSELGIIKSKDFQEKFHWKLLNNNQLEVKIKEEDNNTFTSRLLDKGTYSLIASQREYNKTIYEQVEIIKEDNIPICTIMRRKLP